MTKRMISATPCTYGGLQQTGPLQAEKGDARLASLSMYLSENMHRRHLSPSKLGKKDDVEQAGHGAERSTEFKPKRPRLGKWMMIALAAYVVIDLIITNRRPRQTVNWNGFKQDYQRRYQRAPPDTLKQWLEFATSKDCETVRFYDAIERDISVFRARKLKYSEVLHETMQYTDYFAAYELKNNRLSLTNWQTIFEMAFVKRIETAILQRGLKWLLQPLVHHKPPIHTKFVFNLRDEPTDKQDANYPIFSSCHASLFNDNLVYNDTRTKTTIDEDSITRDLLVPYYFSIYVQHRGLWFWPFYSRGPPWKQRKDSIIWRGSTTGLPWGDAPRFWLLEQYGGTGIHKIVPGVDADFAFVRIVQNENGQDLPPEKYRRAESMSYREMQQHKYVLDVDGNSFTERFPKLLRSGSLVFKSTKYREWFSERLEPWVDYIPVNYDLSDLKEKIEWAHTHQALAESIAEHGRETVERHIRPEDQQCYTYRLLLEYHALFES